MTPSRNVPWLAIAVGSLIAMTGCVAAANAPVADASHAASATGAHTVAVQSTAVPIGSGPVQIAAGLESSYVLQGSDGQTYMVVDLQAASAAMQVSRPSMGVSLVVDRSGSMAGEKIVNARAAAMSFIQNMADGDVVSIFQYDDVVEQIAPPTLVNAASRAGLMATVNAISPRGSTNLHGGLAAGIGSLSSPQAERPVRRVILISDGLANVGPSSPQELGGLAAGAAMQGISVTSIGVGLDYDENVMNAVAMRSGGRFYHLQEPAQLAAILQTELNNLGTTVARGVYLELLPAQGVEILGATGADLSREGSLVRLNVGDMLGSQTRQVVLPIRVPTGGGPAQTAAQVTLRYRSADSDETHEQAATVAYQLAASQTQVSSGLAPQFAVAVEQHRSTEARMNAARLLGEGEADRAADVLQAQAVASRARAQEIGGAAAEAITDFSDDLTTGSVQTRAARSAPAARARQLELNDEAMEAQAY